MIRCSWSESSDIMRKYHDEEWGVPVHDDTKHFEFFILDAAQAGLSWKTVLEKREGYMRAFGNFDIEFVSKFGEHDINRLLEDSRIIRNKQKIRAAIINAKQIIQLQKEFGSFDKYIWSFVNGKTIQNEFENDSDIPAQTNESQIISKDLKKRGFQFVGPVICYSYMQAAGLVNDHIKSCFRYKELY